MTPSGRSTHVSPRTMLPGVRYVLRRKSDGLFMVIWGWDVRWEAMPSAACPVFNTANMGPTRRGGWHSAVWRRFRAGCELHPLEK